MSFWKESDSVFGRVKSTVKNTFHSLVLALRTFVVSKKIGTHVFGNSQNSNFHGVFTKLKGRYQSTLNTHACMKTSKLLHGNKNTCPDSATGSRSRTGTCPRGPRVLRSNTPTQDKTPRSRKVIDLKNPECGGKQN